MIRDNILITVKTYPTLSKKYGETVCTAGLREDGSWVRIYPVPFRRLEEQEQYRKYDWISCGLVRGCKDPRPETRHPVDLSHLVPVGRMDTGDNWRERRNLVLGKAKVFTDMEDLIARAKANECSLAVFKPKEVLDLVWEEEERDWDPVKVEQMRHLSNQMELFSEDDWRREFKVIPKLPYSFSYGFRDGAGKQRELQILDWEIGALYWNCLRDAHGDEPTALAKVKQKYLTQFRDKDLHFFLGTTQEFHFIGTNPWVIIGVLPIPHETRLSLF